MAAARGLEIVHDGRGRVDLEVRTAPEGAWVEFPPARLFDASEEDVYHASLEWVRTGTQWRQRTQADGEARPRVRLRWPGATPAPSPRDDAHLRALGYLR